MTSPPTEQRQYQRRSIQFSVLLSTIDGHESSNAELCLGDIIDVGLGGVCIQTHCFYDIARGGKVLMLASTGEIEGVSGSDVPVQIRGEVVWKKGKGQNLLGIRYL